MSWCVGAAHEHTQLMDGLPADCHTDSWPQDRGGGEDLMEACKVPSSFPGKPMCLCATRERTYSTISPPHCTDSHAHRHTHTNSFSYLPFLFPLSFFFSIFLTLAFFKCWKSGVGWKTKEIKCKMPISPLYLEM